MAVEVVDTAPTSRRHTFLLDVGGALLHTALRVAICFALATAILAGLLVVAAGQGEPSGRSQGSPLLISGIALGIALLAAILSGRVGRRRHGLVLYLRRFGYADATEAVTRAVVGSLGRSWRLVTLDDARTSPVGLGPRTRRARSGLRAAEAVGRTVLGIPWRISYATFLISFWLLVLLLAYSSFRRHHPVGYLDDLLQHVHLAGGEAGLVKTLATTALVSGLVFALLMFVQAAAMMVWAAPRTYLTSVARTTALMESAMQDGIRERADVARVARAIALRSRRGSSARLWVVKVDSSLWQEAVLQIAMKSQRILIDVSHTSTNVQWEIDHLTAVLGTRCVFVGSRKHVSWLQQPRESVTRHPDRRLRDSLQGRSVLTYADDDTSRAIFEENLAQSSADEPRVPRAVRPSGSGRDPRGPAWAPVPEEQGRRVGRALDQRGPWRR